MKRGIIALTCALLWGLLSADLGAQSIIYNEEYRVMQTRDTGRAPQSAEDEEALKAFRKFRYSLIKSLRRHRSPQSSKGLEEHWRKVSPR